MSRRSTRDLLRWAAEIIALALAFALLLATPLSRAMEAAAPVSAFTTDLTHVQMPKA
jgi:hypothetical protein